MQFYALILTVLLLMPSNLLGRESAPPLLLSFDVELDNHVQALEKLNLKDPATYFVTGQFAGKFPKTTRELSKVGTVGSHSFSHPNLTELSLEEIRKDLQESSQAIESATGHAPIWFRAPYLAVNEEVLTVARDLGFLYDSSEPERWLQQKVLREFPISINDTNRILFSDYDFFSSFGFDDMMALDLLKENYLSRYETGRPFVFLLHPSIIAEHSDVLHQFIAFVKDQGGQCLSFDQYLEQILADSPVDNVGVRIDLSLGTLDINSTISNLVEAQVTDAFVLARDKTGQVYYDKENAKDGSIETQFSQLVRGLHKAGIQVHASIPVLHNAALVKQFPDQAMADGRGKASQSWVSPSHPQTIGKTKQIVSELLTNFPIVGIHLDELAYPNLQFDYSQEALKRFKLDTGIQVDNKVAANVLPNKHYVEWVAWRSAQISGIIETVATVISEADREIVLSATLDAKSLTNFRSMEQSGQDYRFLARDLDMIIVIPTDDSDTELSHSLSRLISLSRFKIGHKSLLISLPIDLETTVSKNGVEQLRNQLNTVRRGANGVVLSPYRTLFAEKPRGSDRLDNIRSLIDSVRQPAKSPPTQVVPITFTKEAQASPAELEKQSAPIYREKLVQPAGDHTVLMQICAVLGGLSLFAFLGFRFIRNRRFDKKTTIIEEKIVILNWQKLDKLICDNQISGHLVQAVASHLRTFDPVNTTRYRMALVIDIVAQTPQQLSLNDLVTSTVSIPGWQVLAMSHLREAVTHGYLQIDHDLIKVTPQGTAELESMKASGFDQDHWIFVEQRLHENLKVSCPNCGEDNLAHWYWSNFTCNKCGKEVAFQDCSNVSRRSNAKVAIDQHYYV